MPQLLNTGDNFVLPAQYRDLSMRAEISAGPSAPAQTIPYTMKINDCVEFGKYLTFKLSSEGSEEKTTRDAFRVLFAAQRQQQLGATVLPKFMSLDRPNARFKLHNNIVHWLKENGLGWKKEALGLGDKFVTLLGDVLWCVSESLNKEICVYSSICLALVKFIYIHKALKMTVHL